LHDVFQFSFETVSTIVGRSPAACRQLASRARRHVQDNVRPARFDVEPAMHREVVSRFIAACAQGDMNALLAVLDPDVEGVADIGARHTPFAAEAIGADEVAARVLALFGPTTPIRLEPRHVNGELGIVASRGDRVFAVMSLTIAKGRITEIHSVVDPEKLKHVVGPSTR
jgi:RNA polymerase sigma-70 factor (ECF subfamily)